VSTDTFLRRGLDQEREIEAGVGWRAGRRVNLDRKECDERLRYRARNICYQEYKNGRRMAGCLRCDKVVAAWHGRLAAVVGIRRRALALFAAIRRFLIELSTSKAVERTYKQKDCKDGNGNMHATAHLFQDTISQAAGIALSVQSPEFIHG
jgi:hypothetical protein